MTSLGKFTNSLLSATNENTFALANLNFDFSLVKIEAPAEYSPFGRALASRQRELAEDGKRHQLARKLGALFEQSMPSVPKLVTAYGKRASQIIESPGINPVGDQRHGPFAEFVSADGTSIWAAATSGTASIAVHLLACLLARTFDGPKATSVWAEFVLERQKEITKMVQSEMCSAALFAAANAARLDYSRDELRQWDASARAWLQSADTAMKKERVQMQLILKNLQIPVAQGETLYEGVMRAWRQAMIGLERIFCGEPQIVTDGAILLALSAWHLYPDLLVLSHETTRV